MDQKITIDKERVKGNGADIYGFVIDGTIHLCEKRDRKPVKTNGQYLTSDKHHRFDVYKTQTTGDNAVEIINISSDETAYTLKNAEHNQKTIPVETLEKYGLIPLEEIT